MMLDKRQLTIMIPKGMVEASGGIDSKLSTTDLKWQ